MLVNIPLEALKCHGAVAIDRIGGYIDEDTVIVNVQRQEMGLDLFQLVLLDTKMHAPPCFVGEETEKVAAVICLGDGRWLSSTDDAGNWICQTRPEYLLLGPEVAGGMGEGTTFDTSHNVSSLDYAFTDWLGDCILTTTPCFIVTEKVAQNITEIGLTGATLDGMEVTFSDEADDLMDEGAREMLPPWRWLRVTGEPFRSDFGLVSADLVVSRRVLTLLWQLGLHNAEVKAASAGDP